MKLTDEQIQQYDRDGYLVLNGVLSPAEVKLLQQEAEMLCSPERGHPDANVLEKDGKTLRAAWAVEMDSMACEIAMRLPRIYGPIQQLMGKGTYLYQSRLNYKIAGSGDVFQWHQDYASWAADGVPDGSERKMLSVLITLNDTYAESGPLRFIPGSHKEGIIRPDYDEETTSYALHVVPDTKVDELLDGDEPAICTGPAGTMLIFDGNLVHGSQKNRSDQDRRNLYFAYNVCDNLPDPDFPRRKHACPYIMSPETGPIDLVADDALIQLAMDRGLTA